MLSKHDARTAKNRRLFQPFFECNQVFGFKKNNSWLLFEIIDDVRTFQTKSISMRQPHTHALITQNIYFKVWVGIKVRFKRWYGRELFILGWVSRLVFIACCIVWFVNDGNPGRERSSHRRTLLTSPLVKGQDGVFRPGSQIRLLKSVWSCSSNQTEHVISRSEAVLQSLLTPTHWHKLQSLHRKEGGNRVA